MTACRKAGRNERAMASLAILTFLLLATAVVAVLVVCEAGV
jgi:hypothetical protein